MADSFKTARTPKWCERTSWFPGCGREILKGERYLSFYRGGLSSFALCADCAAKASVSA